MDGQRVEMGPCNPSAPVYHREHKFRRVFSDYVRFPRETPQVPVNEEPSSSRISDGAITDRIASGQLLASSWSEMHELRDNYPRRSLD
jgi:hypothetical protein